MALHTRLQRQRNSGIYYCRVAVPKVVQPLIGKRELKVSLRTSDPTLARERIKEESLRIDRLLAEAQGRFAGVTSPEHGNPLSSPLIRAHGHGYGVTFGALVERFANLPEKQSLGHKTKLEYRITFKLFAALLGEDTPITRISRAHCRRVQETLAVLPPNSAKRFPDMHPAKVVEIAKRDGLTPMTVKTANNLLTRLCAIMGWAHREGLIASNPAQGLYLPENEHGKEKRHPFTIAQLNALFGSDAMQQYRNEASPRWWIPMLALWTGARLNELCQLRVDDVAERGGIHCLLIRDGDGKRLKTANAHRVIPLHPKLVAFGFLDYVEAARQRNDAQVFTGLPVNKHGNASDKFSKWFGFFLHDLEVKTSKTCFHSFRHTFRDALREAGIARELVQALGGWTKGNGTEEVYGQGYSTMRLYEAIQRIDYAGFECH